MSWPSGWRTSRATMEAMLGQDTVKVVYRLQKEQQ